MHVADLRCEKRLEVAGVHGGGDGSPLAADVMLSASSLTASAMPATIAPSPGLPPRTGVVTKLPRPSANTAPPWVSSMDQFAVRTQCPSRHTSNRSTLTNICLTDFSAG